MSTFPDFVFFTFKTQAKPLFSECVLLQIVDFWFLNWHAL